MKRKIKDREHLSSCYCRPGEGSVTLTLDCGHTKTMKQSAEPKAYCLCKECDLELEIQEYEKRLLREGEVEDGKE